MVGGSSMKHSNWTNQEVRKLHNVHADGNPSLDELVKMFPRHTRGSIKTTARHLGLRRSDLNLKWLKIAHLHFAERDLINGGTKS
jgi:hypothetical protein